MGLTEEVADVWGDCGSVTGDFEFVEPNEVTVGSLLVKVPDVVSGIEVSVDPEAMLGIDTVVGNENVLFVLSEYVLVTWVLGLVSEISVE